MRWTRDLLSSKALRLFVLVWLWAFLCHAIQILRYSNSLPLDDQWDSEAFFLLRPWIEGNLSFVQMFELHNEHHIFFKRLYDIFVFSLNSDYWDNRVFAIANAAIYAIVIAILGCTTLSIENISTRRILLAFILLLPIVLINYENTLRGFQSPFYFLFLFTLIIIAISSKISLSLRDATLVFVLSVFSLGTLASGFLVAPIAAMLALIRLSSDQKSKKFRIILATLLFCLTIAGYLLIPKLGDHDAFHAQSSLEFIASAAKVLGWPIPVLPVAWLPITIWAIQTRRLHRLVAPTDMLFFGLAAWVFLQSTAIAYGRGHDMEIIPSRYTDTLMLGLVANLYFSCRVFLDFLPISRAHTRSAGYFGALAMGLSMATFMGVAIIDGVLEANAMQTSWQSTFVVTEALLQNAAIDADKFPLPYPRMDRLKMLLADPSLRQLLRINQDGLPMPCSPQQAGTLSRSICAADQIVPHIAFQKLTKTEITSRAAPISRCHLDDFVGGPSDANLPSDLPIRFKGWVISDERLYFSIFNQPKILLLGKNDDYSVTGSPTRRPDVANALASSRYYWTGLDITTSASEVAAGDYEIAMQNGTSAPCHTGTYVHKS